MTHKLIVIERGAQTIIEARHGETLLDALTRAGIYITAPCGGRGTCNKCNVRVLEADGAETDDMRPACQTRARGDMKISIQRRKAAILSQGVSNTVRADGERGLGVAVDIGTTTLAAYLMDLRTGEALASAMALNPQRAHGADVVSRCGYAMESDANADRLKREAIDAIKDMTNQLLAQTGRGQAQITRYYCVGNTVMMHLLAGLPVGGIAVAPFTPAYTRAHARTIDDMNVLLGDCVSGYVGADTVAALLACELDIKRENALLIDIGTNGEIAVLKDGEIVCCACAAGPAFEGAHITCGMGAAEGAIDHAQLNGGKWSYTTIGGKPAEGFCGSGLIDVIAGLLAAGIISDTGRLEADAYITDKLYITQKDVREVQLAKAAVAAGIRILLGELKLEPEQVKRVYLAGGFGNYISVSAACAIGMLPKALETRVTPVGNAAGEGAKHMLINAECRARAEALRARMRYVELSSRADFRDEFTEQLLFEGE